MRCKRWLPQSLRSSQVSTAAVCHWCRRSQRCRGRRRRSRLSQRICPRGSWCRLQGLPDPARPGLCLQGMQGRLTWRSSQSGGCKSPPRRECSRRGPLRPAWWSRCRQYTACRRGSHSRSSCPRGSTLLRRCWSKSPMRRACMQQPWQRCRCWGRTGSTHWTLCYPYTHCTFPRRSSHRLLRQCCSTYLRDRSSTRLHWLHPAWHWKSLQGSLCKW